MPEDQKAALNPHEYKNPPRTDWQVWCQSQEQKQELKLKGTKNESKCKRFKVK